MKSQVREATGAGTTILTAQFPSLAVVGTRITTPLPTLWDKSATGPFPKYCEDK